MATTATNKGQLSTSSTLATNQVDELITDEMLNLEDVKLREQLNSLVVEHGIDVIQSWRARDRHQHALAHCLVNRKKPLSLQALGKLGYDLDVQRVSDRCTPLHLSAWIKMPEITDILLALGANPSITNRYGESTEKLVAVRQQMDNIVFLDLELTCLPGDGSPNILECAVVITDKELKTLAEAEWVIHHDVKQLEVLSPWHQETFASVSEGGNGLFDAVLASSTSDETFQTELLALLKHHTPPNACPLGGFSVHCDREVLLTCAPTIRAHLSHQVIDVSTLLSLARRWMPDKSLDSSFANGGADAHRAMADVRRSIEVLAWARSNLFQSA